MNAPFDTLPALTRRQGLALGLLGLGGLVGTLSACGRPDEAPPAPSDIVAGLSCDLDGMLLADYPGPKGQILYVGERKPQWFCDTVELFSVLLKPEQQRAVRIAYTQDMAQADWEVPRGHWFDVRQGFYVLGSKRQGSMGPTLASFREPAAAQAFAQNFGGKVLAFAALKPDMVDLSGGAQQDSRM